MVWVFRDAREWLGIGLHLVLEMFSESVIWAQKVLSGHISQFDALTITVKPELSSKSMNFLDTVVYKGNIFKETGALDTKVYFKPRDTLELLQKKSHHPNHTF